jgi:hypothetical protein
VVAPNKAPNLRFFFFSTVGALFASFSLPADAFVEAPWGRFGTSSSDSSMMVDGSAFFTAGSFAGLLGFAGTFETSARDPSA